MPASVILSTIGGAGSQFFDNNGAVLSGGKLYTYEAGTTTPLATYTDSSGTVANANPVVLDSAGRVPNNGIWIVYGSQYKFVLKDSADNTLGTWDSFPGSVISDKIATLETDVSTINTNTSDVANCFVRATNSGSQSTVNGSSSNAKITFDTEVTDLGSDYDSTTSTFTVPFDGTYMISFTGIVSILSGSKSIDDNAGINIYQDGVFLYNIASYKYSSTSEGGGSINGSQPVHLSAGKLITLQITTSSSFSTTWQLDAGAYLTITCISKA